MKSSILDTRPPVKVVFVRDITRQFTSRQMTQDYLQICRNSQRLRGVWRHWLGWQTACPWQGFWFGLPLQLIKEGKKKMFTKLDKAVRVIGRRLKLGQVFKNHSWIFPWPVSGVCDKPPLPCLVLSLFLYHSATVPVPEFLPSYSGWIRACTWLTIPTDLWRMVLVGQHLVPSPPSHGQHWASAFSNLTCLGHQTSLVCSQWCALSLSRQRIHILSPIRRQR